MRGALTSAVLALVLSASCASSGAPEPACAVSAADAAWIERATDAWRFTALEITGIGNVPNYQAVFFDAACVLESDNALSLDSAGGVTWRATPHTGAVTLPNGDPIPAGVMSAAVGEEDLLFFMMSTPSVWRAGGLDRGGPVALEDTMVAVLLHEGSHIAQTGPYGPRLGALISANNLPDSFSDDSMQHEFRDNAEFSTSVARETELFFAAAAAGSEEEAKRLAREARAMMRARQARWLIGEHAYYVEAEDIWLTFEGSGQWAGYQWMVHPAGGGVPAESAMMGFRRGGGWWSQSEGFAIALVVDRLYGSGWKRRAFGDGAHTLLEMLDLALAD